MSALYHETFGKSTICDPEINTQDFLEDLSYRNENKIPPGYKDARKPDGGVGDLVIWKTILSIAGERKKPLAFVTGEEKADRQNRADNRGLFPRPELLDEYRRASGGQPFFILSFSDLLELYGANRDVVNEVREQEAVDVDVDCPGCGSTVTCHIREHPGASATPRCDVCEERFHAHWAGPGNVKVRRRGFYSVEGVECPECNSMNQVRLESTPGASGLPSCSSCGAKFHVHRGSQKAVIVRARGGKAK